MQSCKVREGRVSIRLVRGYNTGVGWVRFECACMVTKLKLNMAANSQEDDDLVAVRSSGVV